MVLPYVKYLKSLVYASLSSIGLYIFNALATHTQSHGYLVWNLSLAWLPLLFAIWLHYVLKRKLWSSWEALLATGLWLLFLPNSFYMVSDFIHLRNIPAADILNAAVLYMSFIFTALIIGFTSLLVIHSELKRRYGQLFISGVIVTTLLACSLAIYIGRDLRWNSWDILINPGGLLFDLSDRLLRPAAYPQMFVTIGSFFVLLLTSYLIFYRAAGVAYETK